MEGIGVYAWKEDAFCFGCQRLHEPIKNIWETTKRR
jgi:predicted Fe-S protein YdhL (DUF1289 family)